MSREGTQREQNKIYYSIFNGEFRTKVPKGTEGASTRINKNDKEVTERIVPDLYGKIEDIYFEDSDFGLQLKIMLDPNQEGQHPVMSFNAESRDGRDMMRKLPSLDFTKEVRFLPYRFPNDAGDIIAGINLYQENDEGDFAKKIESYFFDPETKNMRNGHPVINWEKAKEKEKKIYGIERDEFLQKFTKENTALRVKKETKSESEDNQDDSLDKVFEKPAQNKETDDDILSAIPF